MAELTDSTMSQLVTPELFANYIGKTPSAIRKMASANKLPVIRMKDPANPDGQGEIYIHKGEWDAFADHLVSVAGPEWHSWKDRLMTTGPATAAKRAKTGKAPRTPRAGRTSA
ncbi:Cox family DNA-binding protein [Serratia fonticola]|uniref:Cox family DNA-binding protein n=1 Tax=Serratia fonticola TaxID=47917 RepID=UPI00301C6E15